MTSLAVLADVAVLSVRHRRVGILVGHIDDEILVALIAVTLLGSLLLPSLGFQIGERGSGPRMFVAFRRRRSHPVTLITSSTSSSSTSFVRLFSVSVTIAVTIAVTIPVAIPVSVSIPLAFPLLHALALALSFALLPLPTAR